MRNAGWILILAVLSGIPPNAVCQHLEIPVRDSQPHPLSPQESLSRIELDGAWKVELVACEPLVRDPVECAWDARGRLFVADMIDYPLGPAEGGEPLSRIQQLVDENGDGRMDRAIPFAQGLDHVQGLFPHEGGWIATTRTEILFLKDTDGDGRADLKRPLIEGFNPKHSQLSVSSPRWGGDGWIYFNNGLNTDEVYPSPREPAADPIALSRTNFRWHPRTGALETVAARGQFGAAFDDWGRYFFCTNRNPLMHAVLPQQALLRNPHAGLTLGHEDVAPFGPESRVYPLQVTHTTSGAHIGTNTACCGVGVYRADAMPELRGNVFVCEPTGQLITRYRIEPKGASLTAHRVGEQTEFFRSSDEWCRPVNITTGPDGALYVCDIYRRWIDHARFLPEQFVKENDVRQGENEGRIYRIVPQRWTAPPPSPPPADWQDWLTHPDGWQRDTAQRMLSESGDENWIAEARRLPEHRESLEAILASPDADSAPPPQQIRQRALALAKAAEDSWIASAVLSSSSHSAGRVLAALVSETPFAIDYSPIRADTLRRVARASARSKQVEDLRPVAALLRTAEAEWWTAPVVIGLSEGDPGLRTRLADQPELQQALDRHNETVISRIDDPAASTEQRAAALPLIQSHSWDRVEPLLAPLLLHRQPTVLREAALDVLRHFSAKVSEAFLYQLLEGTEPELRREAVNRLILHNETGPRLIRRLANGEFSPALVDSESRWRYLRREDEIGDLARAMFDAPSEDREAVIERYLAIDWSRGDAERGRQLFSTHCVACHRLGDLGTDVGPSLADVRIKPPEGLVSDILDPNRMFEARWSSYLIETRDGGVLSGLLESETDLEVTLKLMGGATVSVSRSEIQSFEAQDRSLMPVGLEASLNEAQMADLIAFLTGG